MDHEQKGSQPTVTCYAYIFMYRREFIDYTSQLYILYIRSLEITLTACSICTTVCCVLKSALVSLILLEIMILTKNRYEGKNLNLV